MNEILKTALTNELAHAEELLWSATPDADSIRSSLLLFSTLWLSGMFLISVGILRDTTDTNVLVGLIFLLVMVAAAGVLMLILDPRRAARTIYAITDQRIMTLCATRRFVPYISDRSERKIMLRKSVNSVAFFYFMNLPAQVLYFILAYDAFTALMSKGNIFVGLGFLVATLGWLQPIIKDMRLPFPQFRDPPRTFYACGDIFVSQETLDISDFASAIRRPARDGLQNLFILSTNSGCMRFRAIPEGEKVEQLLIDLSKTRS
ncbi:MAG TPA: hypothetical protein V6C72_13910 [Chroococcales cyanobacterium]